MRQAGYAFASGAGGCEVEDAIRQDVGEPGGGRSGQEGASLRATNGGEGSGVLRTNCPASRCWRRWIRDRRC